MKLPRHLKFVEYNEQAILEEESQYTLYLLNKITGQIHPIVIPTPKPYQERLVDYFVREFERALKEQLNENIER